MEIIFASQNKNKIYEISSLLPKGISMRGIEGLKIEGELPETQQTLEGNALQKAKYVAEISGRPSFADDTGLEIECLDGRPGVYSARYAGEQKDANENMKKILQEMENCENRNAKFRTVIAFVDGTHEFLFQGVVTGTIATEKSGEKGFGYDPIFIPEGSLKTFAEMNLEEKNMMSHRARAFQAFVKFLEKQAK